MIILNYALKNETPILLFDKISQGTFGDIDHKSFTFSRFQHIVHGGP